MDKLLFTENTLVIMPGNYSKYTVKNLETTRALIIYKMIKRWIIIITSKSTYTFSIVFWNSCT